MAELDLHDIINIENYTLSDNPGNVSIEIINNGGESSSILKDIPPNKNLMAIAVKKYLNLINKGGEFTFGIIKNIPAGAGLGGGSSNAAASLKIVAELFGRGIDNYVMEAALYTGSDVPFFLYGGFAFVEGRGEYVTPIKIHNNSHILLVNNGIHINTGDAYNSLKMEIEPSFRLRSTTAIPDAMASCRPHKTDSIDKKTKIADQINTMSKWKDIFRNDFEPAIFNQYPQIGLIKEKMYKAGAVFALMSGSGSTVFGVFNDENSAKNLKKALEKQGDKVYYNKFRHNIN